MWKAVLAGTTALAIAGTSLVYAQKSSDDFQRTQRWRLVRRISRPLVTRASPRFMPA